MNYFKLLEHFSEATDLPISIFEQENLIFKGHRDKQDYNIPMFLLECLPRELPDIWISSTPETLFFGGLLLQAQNQLLVVGPVSYRECSINQCERILHRLGRKRQEVGTFQKVMEHFACCDAFHLQNHLRFLNHVLNGVEESEISKLEFKWKNIVPKSEEYFMGVVSEPEEDDIEENLVAYVKNGKVEEVEAYFNKVFFSTDNLMMKEMQNINLQRNLICGANMLNSRIAIQAGADKQIIRNLAGYYLELISRADNSTDLSHLFYKMILDYTKRVKSVQEFQSDSMVSKRINSYIQSHLYEKMSTAIIAKALHMDEAYLSEEFRKSTGQTVTRYIQECKIREAAFLLERGYSPTESSNMLEFSSPSYFGVVFKKIMGITPMEYKRTME